MFGLTCFPAHNEAHTYVFWVWWNLVNNLFHKYPSQFMPRMSCGARLFILPQCHPVLPLSLYLEASNLATPTIWPWSNGYWAPYTPSEHLVWRHAVAWARVDRWEPEKVTLFDTTNSTYKKRWRHEMKPLMCRSQLCRFHGQWVPGEGDMRVQISTPHFPCFGNWPFSTTTTLSLSPHLPPCWGGFFFEVEVITTKTHADLEPHISVWVVQHLAYFVVQVPPKTAVLWKPWEIATFLSHGGEAWNSTPLDHKTPS